MFSKRAFIAVLVVLASLGIWRSLPIYPEAVENVTLGSRLVGAVITGVMETAILAERLGLIADSVVLIQPIFNFTINNTSPIDGVIIEHTSIAGVPVIIFTPQEVQGSRAKAIIYFHGGGFIIGNAMMHFHWTLRIAKSTGAIVISVEYRLAPQHPFPAAADDCLQVTKAVFDSAESLGVDRNRIAVAGDSAGGNLAAVVAIDLADSIKYRLKTQILLSPLLVGFGDSVLPSQVHFGGLMHLGYTFTKYAGLPYSRSIQTAYKFGHHISTEDARRFKRFIDISSLPDDLLSLIPDRTSAATADPGAGEDELAKHPNEVVQLGKLALNQRAWPLINEDDTKLSQLPRALIQICGVDALRDEALLYFNRLRTLGVPVTLSFLPNAQHVEPLLRDLTGGDASTASLEGLNDIVDFVKEAL